MKWNVVPCPIMSINLPPFREPYHGGNRLVRALEVDADALVTFEK
jgi:hypothetical protein